MKPARWTLRARLVVAIVGLSALALVLANVFAIALLRASLLERVDEELVPLTKIITSDLAIPGLRKPDMVFTPRLADVSRVYVYDGLGRLVREAPNTQTPGPDVGDPPDLRPGAGPYTLPGGTGHSWRVMAVGRQGNILLFAASLREVEETQRSLLVISTGVSVFVLLLLGLTAATVVRLGLRPLTRMESTAAQITEGDFGRRVPDPDPHTEPGRLGLAMNVMLDRVESEIAARTESEANMRRFLADASHELRTPLTSVRGFAELYRRGGSPPGTAMDESMRRIEEEATRMGVLVNDLLTLAQLDEERPLERHAVDLLEVAADTIRDARARVPGRQVRLTGLGDSFGPVLVHGDEARLRQVAANLVGNALTHTPADAQITVRVGARGREGVLEVSDTGPGVAAGHAPYIFERLYRAGSGRSRADGGAGLGLAIVAAIVRAHHGRVELDSEPGHGATFRVLLPVGDSEPAPR
ncbi:ATP-binding protein [Nonomuraea sp. NPDC046570]|uniref:sensor histidine kinase n=1 Tax=Nonomuraea sp. NPDC046570 TaxID=3155255 RepID=UPI00341015A8